MMWDDQGGGRAPIAVVAVIARPSGMGCLGMSRYNPFGILVNGEGEGYEDLVIGKAKP